MVDKDARTRLPGRCTRVRRGGTRRHGRDVVDRASVPRRAVSRHVADLDSIRRGQNRRQRGRNRRQRGRNRRRRGPNRANSDRIGLYRPKRPSQAKIQKKKKRGANTPFDLRTLNLNTQNPQTLTLSPKLLSHSVPHLPSAFSVCSVPHLCVLRP